MTEYSHTLLTGKKIWQVTREYAGIAEAGGVKNVSCSLAEELVRFGAEVTNFMPLYGCTEIDSVTEFDIIPEIEKVLSVNGNLYRINFAKGFSHGVKIIFIVSSVFTQKTGVYTYTSLDELLNLSHKRGQGHTDAAVMNVLHQKAVLEYALQTRSFPEFIHCQDATTALLPVFAQEFDEYKKAFEKIKFVVTIHNAGAGYHHEFPLDFGVSYTGLPEACLKKGLLYDKVEPFLLVEPYATLTTVSPWYAQEICDPDNGASAGLSEVFSQRNTKICGITNGIDYEKYNPKDHRVSLIPYDYDPETGDLKGKKRARQNFISLYKKEWTEKKISSATSGCSVDSIQQYGFLCPVENAVLFSYHGRMAIQKGIDVLVKAAEIVIGRSDAVYFIVTGQGDPVLEAQCIAMAKNYPGRFLYLKGYERSVARECVAVSDFLILPSHFEPCCLEDFIGQIYGTIPIAHASGGLKKIQNGKTGFLYKNNNPFELSELLLEVEYEKRYNPGKFTEIIVSGANNVHENYSWKRVIEEYYMPLYCTL